MRRQVEFKIAALVFQCLTAWPNVGRQQMPTSLTQHSHVTCVVDAYTTALVVWYGMVWYGMVNVDLYSAIVTKVSNALNTLVPRESQVFGPS